MFLVMAMEAFFRSFQSTTCNTVVEDDPSAHFVYAHLRGSTYVACFNDTLRKRGAKLADFSIAFIVATVISPSETT